MFLRDGLTADSTRRTIPERYTHGAEAVMNVIVGHLPHDQSQELRKWASGELLNWRMRSEPDVELPPDAPVLGN